MCSEQNFIPSVRNFVEDQLLDEDSDEEEEYKLKNRKVGVSMHSLTFFVENNFFYVFAMERLSFGNQLD